MTPAFAQGFKKLKTCVTLLSLILLTGCQIPRYTWYQAGVTPEQTQRDIADCDMRAMTMPVEPPPAPITPAYQQPQTYTVQQNYPGSYTVTPQAGYDTTAVANGIAMGDWQARVQQQRKDFFNACMRAKGYQLIRVTEPK